MIETLENRRLFAVITSFTQSGPESNVSASWLNGPPTMAVPSTQPTLSIDWSALDRTATDLEEYEITGTLAVTHYGSQSSSDVDSLVVSADSGGSSTVNVIGGGTGFHSGSFKLTGIIPTDENITFSFNTAGMENGATVYDRWSLQAVAVKRARPAIGLSFVDSQLTEGETGQTLFVTRSGYLHDYPLLVYIDVWGTDITGDDLTTGSGETPLGSSMQFTAQIAQGFATAVVRIGVPDNADTDTTSPNNQESMVFEVVDNGEIYWEGDIETLVIDELL